MYSLFISYLNLLHFSFHLENLSYNQYKIRKYFLCKSLVNKKKCLRLVRWRFHTTTTISTQKYNNTEHDVEFYMNPVIRVVFMETTHGFCRNKEGNQMIDNPNYQTTNHDSILGGRIAMSAGIIFAV